MNLIWLLVNIVEVIIYAYLGFAALYIFIFGMASLFRYRLPRQSDGRKRRFAVLIPGYKEDAVIIEVARKSLEQDYPTEAFEIIIIADSFQPNTLNELRKLPIRVVEVSFEISTKSKALNTAMAEIGDNYDVALILDADNIMKKDFIYKINQAFDRGFIAVQGHRAAKNMNSSMAILDAVSEEINNSIFRKGHRVLGFSSALIGSGMAFEYAFFKKLMLEIKAVGGFDKELELRLLKDKQKIEYVEDALVLDEKVQKTEVFATQRKRWLSAQFVYFGRFALPGLKELFKSGNFDFADKVYQMIQPPRILLIGILTILTFIMAMIHQFASVWMWTNMLFDFFSWLVIWSLSFLAFLFSIPGKFYSAKTANALLSLPKGFLLMLLSLFKLKGANKRFIHTAHGVDEDKKK
ncbi:MAG: glycosyltransferase [Bacteroidota bacterium]|nr:glycosyltransferase [Bacteroidota bacterium]